jgi:hypothetical protein
MELCPARGEKRCQKQSEQAIIANSGRINKNPDWHCTLTAGFCKEIRRLCVDIRVHYNTIIRA